MGGIQISARLRLKTNLPTPRNSTIFQGVSTQSAKFSSVNSFRQDLLSTGLFGGITVAMFGTAFAAALLGALVAPALTAGMTRIMDFQFPEVTLPEFTEEAAEKVRSLQNKYPWVGIVENLYIALRADLDMRKGQKFNKFNSDNKLLHRFLRIHIFN